MYQREELEKLPYRTLLLKDLKSKAKFQIFFWFSLLLSNWKPLFSLILPLSCLVHVPVICLKYLSFPIAPIVQTQLQCHLLYQVYLHCSALTDFPCSEFFQSISNLCHTVCSLCICCHTTVHCCFTCLFYCNHIVTPCGKMTRNLSSTSLILLIIVLGIQQDIQ